MTLYAGERRTGRTKLDGPERMLDALIGVIVWVAGLAILFMITSALFEFGRTAAAGSAEALEFGFGVAIYGGGAIYAIATLICLGRLAVGRRSWSAPLWGGILAGAAILVGYVIMASGV